MSNPVCIFVPYICENGELKAEAGGFGDFFRVFDKNAAGDMLRVALATVQSTPLFDATAKDAKSFLVTFRDLFGLMLVVSVPLFCWALVSLARSRSSGDDDLTGVLAPLKIFVVGTFLIPVFMVLKFVAELATWAVGQVYEEDTWLEHVERGFSLGGFFSRAFGFAGSGFLNAEAKTLQWLVPMLLVLGLVTYSLSSFKSNYTMGRPSRWMWSLLITATLLQPALTAYLGIGGNIIMTRDASDGDKSTMAIALIFTSLFLWMFVFFAINKKIKTAVDNRVEVRGRIRNRPDGTQQQRVEARQISDNRSLNLNSKTRVGGLRQVRYDMADRRGRLAAEAATAAGHPGRALYIRTKHSFFKGRRSSP